MKRKNSNSKYSKNSLVILTALLAGLGQGATAQAATGLRTSTALPEATKASAFLGGVALKMPPITQKAASTYNFVSGWRVYGPSGNGAPVAPETTKPSLDTMKTASIMPGVFGSMALRMKSFPVSARWSPIYQAVSTCISDTGCGDDPEFQNLVDSAHGKGFKEKLSLINSGINRMITYRSDREVYGQEDYWAKPGETLRKRLGDCEDFAILKMAALLEAGVPAQSMSLVVLQDKRLRVFHAVLSVSTASGNFILDNVRDAVMVDSQLPNYMPLYSFSQERAWIHGGKPGSTQLADVAGGFGRIAPGEGPVSADGTAVSEEGK
ncbi:putative transglutaminase-like cysteine proteinase [Mesorhizobium soli]|uniref:transglutaminase-like cysteine peptidase n=1 Tax=Pseudaminobacter soli (ex Li et al. 2025) TaxID=1295366 RepID=UPI0024738697|nr:transglutaminase-like cysteine peptidase [Mesorhizobium soli]MDH6235245.1 putative transglutaminase-like cysteine proteinase [Mesorhizobium soli]